MIGKQAAMRKRPSLGAGYAWVILTVVWLALEREGFLGLWPPETGGAVAIHAPAVAGMPTSLEGHPTDEDHVVVWRALTGAHDYPRPGAEALQLVMGHRAEVRVRKQLA